MAGTACAQLLVLLVTVVSVHAAPASVGDNWDDGFDSPLMGLFARTVLRAPVADIAATRSWAASSPAPDSAREQRKKGEPSPLGLGSQGGGIPCAACTMVLGIVEQMSQIHDQDELAIMEKLCSFLPQDWPEIREECTVLVKFFGPAVIYLFEKYDTSDEVCHELGICTLPLDQCHLFPLPPAGSSGASSRGPYGGQLRDLDPAVRQLLPIGLSGPDRLVSPRNDPSRDESGHRAKMERERVVEAFSRFRSSSLARAASLPNAPFKLGWNWPWVQLADHKPVSDSDGDLFSTVRTLRGYAWRGADCNDNNAEIYPGRASTTLGPEVDHDCNGIYGVDNSTGKSWEAILCENTTRMGSILLGDSAGAHFHVPPEWLNSTEITEDVYLNLLQIAENEIDWPGMSAATGYHEVTNYNGHPVGPVDSGYLRARAANRCNHRDFQSCAVDGARSSAMLSNIIHSMARSPEDHPATVSYVLLGNDVCNGHPWDRGTTPEEFKHNVLGALQYLDTKLAHESHVVMVGLVDGRILFDTMGKRVHPIGALHDNVLTEDFYDFLNCLGISPCWGWMNSNATARAWTSHNAAELNDVYKGIIANYSGTFKNFDIHYYDCPMKEVVSRWEALGHPAWQLIEPVDGFHPTQFSEELTTKVLEEWYRKDGILPEANPNNERIVALFGDQGGYVPTSSG